MRTYCEAGEVLVCRRAGAILGHVQLVWESQVCEIRSIAVVEGCQRRGIGSALLETARTRAIGSGAERITLGTATSDVENIRFYQRKGFRMDRVERDAFTPARGYPEATHEGIPVRDRVWFTLQLKGKP